MSERIIKIDYASAAIVRDYQAFAITKAADYGDPLIQARLWVLALGGEIGEVCNLVKKWLGHSHPLDTEKLKDEAGDVFWYVACLCELIELKFALLVDSPVTLPQHGALGFTFNLCLTMQSAQSVAASVALYAVDLPGLRNMLLSSLQRIAVAMRVVLEQHNLSLASVLSHNMTKLNARYPQGFSVERSLHRVA